MTPSPSCSGVGKRTISIDDLVVGPAPLAPGSPTGTGWAKTLPSTCDKARALALLIDADKSMRVALDDLDDLAGLPQQAALAAGLVAAQRHADHVAVGRIHRRAGGDIDVAGLVAALWRPFGRTKPKPWPCGGTCRGRCFCYRAMTAILGERGASSCRYVRLCAGLPAEWPPFGARTKCPAP